jgi:hypothetical protein
MRVSLKMNLEESGGVFKISPNPRISLPDQTKIVSDFIAWCYYGQ